MSYKFTHHHLAGSPKYGLSKTLKDTAKVALLVKDDTNHFLSPTQRAELLAAVGEKYEQSKKKKTRTTKKEMLAGVPKTHISQLPAGTPVEQILQGLKDGTIITG
jgi:hypothetical protein